MSRCACALIILVATVVVADCADGNPAVTRSHDKSGFPANEHAMATASADDRPTGGKLSSTIYLRSTQPGRPRRPGPKRGEAPAPSRAALCFKPGALTTDAGESFSGIEAGNPFPGREQIVKTAVRAALIPTVRAELRTAERLATAKTGHRVQRVRRAAEWGIRQVSRDPGLLVRADIPGFERAQALTRRYGLSRC